MLPQPGCQRLPYRCLQCPWLLCPVAVMPVVAMRDKRAFTLSLLLLCVLALPAHAQTPPAEAPQSTASAARLPIISKVEPPNWWANYTPKLMVLLTGENLNDASVESSTG